ncbi:hypothetical protein ABT127_19250 [Streptomyces sp. NPDC001904]|uniref:hypothetical protein n=1 Tax=Streptomyces sp. NPDC001904 TaxID=3154531 RepID=UPI00332B2B7F
MVEHVRGERDGGDGFGLGPSPPSSEPTFEEGLDALLAAPSDQSYAELVDAARGRGAATGHRLLDDPERARSEAADALRRLWKAAVEPEWPSMRQTLRAEMLDRAIQVNREELRAVALDSGDLLPGTRPVPVSGTAHCEVSRPSSGRDPFEDPGRAHHSAADDRHGEADGRHSPDGQ